MFSQVGASKSIFHPKASRVLFHTHQIRALLFAFMRLLIGLLLLVVTNQKDRSAPYLHVLVGFWSLIPGESQWLWNFTLAATSWRSFFAQNSILLGWYVFIRVSLFT